MSGNFERGEVIPCLEVKILWKRRKSSGFGSLLE